MLEVLWLKHQLFHIVSPQAGCTINPIKANGANAPFVLALREDRPQPNGSITIATA